MLRVLTIGVIAMATVMIIACGGINALSAYIQHAVTTLGNGPGYAKESVEHETAEPFLPRTGHCRAWFPGKPRELSTTFGNRFAAGFAGPDFVIADKQVTFCLSERDASLATRSTPNFASGQSIAPLVAEGGVFKQGSSMSSVQPDSEEVIAQKFLDNKCADFAESVGGTVLNKSYISLAGGRYPGREIEGTVATPQNNSSFRMRMFYNPQNHRAFIIHVIGTKDRVNSSQANTFLQSLEVWS